MLEPNELLNVTFKIFSLQDQGNKKFWSHLFQNVTKGTLTQADSPTDLELAVATTPSVHPTGTPTANSRGVSPPLLDPFPFPPHGGRDPTPPPRSQRRLRLSSRGSGIRQTSPPLDQFLQGLSSHLGLITFGRMHGKQSLPSLYSQTTHFPPS